MGAIYISSTNFKINYTNNQCSNLLHLCSSYVFHLRDCKIRNFLSFDQFYSIDAGEHTNMVFSQKIAGVSSPRPFRCGDLAYFIQLKMKGLMQLLEIQLLRALRSHLN